MHKLHRFGRDLVVFCTEGGSLSVLEAGCPHLGADLSSGSVRGEELVCPFHGFGFDVEGRCTSLPEGYGARVPPRLACRVVPSRDVGGLLVVWFDPARAAPRWELRAPDSTGWRPLRTWSWLVRTHPQETGEGSVDLGHLRSVHRYSTAEPIGGLVTDGPRLTARYRASRRAFPGLPIDAITLDFAPELQGLGYSTVEISVVELELKYRAWILATPVDGEVVDYRVGFRMEEPPRLGALSPLLDHLPRALSVVLVEGMTFLAFMGDVALDFPIWENKIYVNPPALVAGDGPIGLYRRWAKQFYADAAPGEARLDAEPASP